MDTLKLEDLDIYRLASEIGDVVWTMVGNWEHFPKNSLGRQFTDAADSISANIAEGYGRYHYKDRKNFCYFSRGSLMETKDWAGKALRRKLMSQADYEIIFGKLQVLHHQLNIYIKKLKANIQRGGANE